jgi:zinc/manganese transport system substrate-binding protein
MLGWLVIELAGDEADVVVLMHGVDPHAWEPSARDVEALLGADLVVANGLGLEAALHETLEQAEAEGVAIFEATDHVVVRASGATGHGDEAGEDAEAHQEDPVEDAHDHGAGDPHFWLDPLAMRDVALALAPVLEAAGIEVADRGEGLAAALEGLEAEARRTMDTVPTERRKLVTGHESMGYFADRFGFALVGVIVPGLSTQGEASAGELSELIETIRLEAVPAIFAELGTPQPVAAAVAAETGAKVIELPTEQLPEDGSYVTFIRTISTQVAQALAG